MRGNSRKGRPGDEDDGSMLMMGKGSSGVDSFDCFDRFDSLSIRQMHKRQSSLIAIQNKEQYLKESIIDFYFRERQENKQIKYSIAKDTLHDLKQIYQQMKLEIYNFITLFSTEIQSFNQLFLSYTQSMKDSQYWRKKYEEMSENYRKVNEQNKQLKKHLEQWQEAKIRRKAKVEEMYYNSAHNENTPNYTIPNTIPYMSATPLKEINNRVSNFSSNKDSLCFDQMLRSANCVSSMGMHRQKVRRKIRVISSKE